MASPRPTLVLVGGGWHVPASYANLTDALRTAGYDVHVPRLPSTNESRPPNADLGNDTSTVRSLVKGLVDDGNDVVAIMHSYGGQVGTNALFELGKKPGQTHSGGVTQLIYMSAFAMPEGKSMIDKVDEFGHGDLMPLAFDFADDMTVLSRDPKTLLVGDSDSSEQDIEAYLTSLVLWNGNCMYNQISQCAWRQIAVTYIHTLQDMTVPLDYQRSMVEYMRREGVEVETFEIVSGHCPNFTKTGEVVDAIEAAVAGVGKTTK